MNLEPSRSDAIELSDESTVEAEFQPDAVRETAYQSEAALETWPRAPS